MDYRHINVYLDKKNKKNKLNLLSFLQVFSFFNIKHLLFIYYGYFFKVSVLSLNSYTDKFIFLNDVRDFNNEIIIFKYTRVNESLIKTLTFHKIKYVDVIYTSSDSSLFYQNLVKSTILHPNSEKFYINLYRILKSTEFSNTKNVKDYIKNLFQNSKNYDLSDTGRFRLNQKLNIYIPKQVRLVTIVDILLAVKLLIKLYSNKSFYYLDDIDDLSVKRIKSTGSIILNQFKIGLVKTERSIKERLVFFNISLEILNLQKLIYPKNITVTLKDFFARSPLSQFMDQVNPLSEITHKRRLTSLGPGGLNRDRASFEVRDVHSSYYGKICPIETPEGPNIGLISSLSLYAKIDHLGFITTPYINIKKNNKHNENGSIVRLNAIDEYKFKIMQFCNIKNLSELNNVIVRYKNHFTKVNINLIDFADVSSRQIISIATALIPFIEHNDANRSLMGSNMQRQGVPLTIPSKPLVGTGLEGKVIRESKNILFSKNSGCVIYVDSNKIIVKGGLNIHIYKLLKFMKSNSATCYTQNPIVKKNEIIFEGQPICDGPSSNDGILALGHNVLVGFMP
ncbi:hypothetical protein E5P55_00820 [Candidatus Pinguicoccus supinus]|uniref:DNA-directed RNA polymerase n=1 Tax=Candidatus Pinguicoccus supinus TaxID=2529394 RepID=A0A7T0BRP2_9BACT|nr:hypothetical protein E5P55_00820 [Candidatus Pinguicoccus supinus]